MHRGMSMTCRPSDHLELQVTLCPSSVVGKAV